VESSVAAVSGGDLEAPVLWKAPPSVGSGGHLARVAAAADGGVAGEEAGERSRPPSSSSFSGPPPSLATRDASSLTLSPRLGGGPPDDRKKDSSPPQQPQTDPTNTALRTSPVAGRDGWVTSPGWCDPKVEVALTRSEALQVAGELALAVDVVMLAVRGIVGTDDTSSASSDDCSLTHGLGPSDRFALALCLKRLCVLHKALGHFPLAEERCVAGISSIRAHMCFHIFSLFWHHSIHGCIRVLEGLGTEFGDGAVGFDHEGEELEEDGPQHGEGLRDGVGGVLDRLAVVRGAQEGLGHGVVRGLGTARTGETEGKRGVGRVRGGGHDW